MNRLPTAGERRRRLATRAIPLAAVAVVSFVAGAATGVDPAPEREAAIRFVNAWANQDFEAMQAELNPRSRRQLSVKQLRDAYLDAQATATLATIDPSEPSDPSDEDAVTIVRAPLRIATIAFGGVSAELALPFADGGIEWDPSLVFPGLRPGELLVSRVSLADRAPILARDGTPLADGPALARSSPLGSEAIDIAGEVGEAAPEDLEQLARQGFPPGTPVGITGLERAFNTRLAGKPGGELLATPESGEPRVLAASEPLPGKSVKTTVDPNLQEATVAALAGRNGGIAVLDTRTGAVRALAGAAFSAPQPPGSVFKIITTTAALAGGKVTLEEEFPVLNGINVGGRFVANASDEYCGGDFRYSFAHSCNSVFAPLGVEVGEEALVRTAERFGFNSPPALYNEAATEVVDPPESSIPVDVGDDLDVGVSAIGQGEVLATPLQMASAAQTVASGGVRYPTAIVVRRDLAPDAEPARVMSKRVAGQITELMVGVVTAGTGTAGAIAEAQVAGKTGTAELGPKPGQEDLPPGVSPEQFVNAWFAAFAPASNPRLAVAVMLIDADASGGEVAAPAAAQVLSAGL